MQGRGNSMLPSTSGRGIGGNAVAPGRGTANAGERGSILPSKPPPSRPPPPPPELPPVMVVSKGAAPIGPPNARILPHAMMGRGPHPMIGGHPATHPPHPAAAGRGFSPQYHHHQHHHHHQQQQQQQPQWISMVAHKAALDVEQKRFHKMKMELTSKARRITKNIKQAQGIAMIDHEKIVAQGLERKQSEDTLLHARVSTKNGGLREELVASAAKEKENESSKTSASSHDDVAKELERDDKLHARNKQLEEALVVETEQGKTNAMALDLECERYKFMHARKSAENKQLSEKLAKANALIETLSRETLESQFTIKKLALIETLSRETLESQCTIKKLKCEIKELTKMRTESNVKLESNTVNATATRARLEASVAVERERYVNLRKESTSKIRELTQSLKKGGRETKQAERGLSIALNKERRQAEKVSKKRKATDQSPSPNVVSTKEEIWYMRFEGLKTFKAHHGHCNAPRNDPHMKLWFWVQKQRTDHMHLREGREQCNKSFTAERIRLLTKIGFNWTVKDTLAPEWEERLQQMKDFQEAYGHTRVPQKVKEPAGLGNWVLEQRRMYKAKQDPGDYSRHWSITKTLTEERICLLDSIGFQWALRDRKKKAQEELTFATVAQPRASPQQQLQLPSHFEV